MYVLKYIILVLLLIRKFLLRCYEYKVQFEECLDLQYFEEMK